MTLGIIVLILIIGMLPLTLILDHYDMKARRKLENALDRARRPWRYPHA